MESNVEHSLSVNVLGLGICPVVCVFASGDVESGPKWRKGSSTELGTMAGQGLEHLPSVGYMLLHLGPFSFGLGQPAPSCRNRFQLRAACAYCIFAPRWKRAAPRLDGGQKKPPMVASGPYLFSCLLYPQVHGNLQEHRQ